MACYDSGLCLGPALCLDLAWLACGCDHGLAPDLAWLTARCCVHGLALGLLWLLADASKKNGLKNECVAKDHHNEFQSNAVAP